MLRAVGGVLEFNPVITLLTALFITGGYRHLMAPEIHQNGMRHPLFTCQTVMLDLINRIFINIPNHSQKEYYRFHYRTWEYHPVFNNLFIRSAYIQQVLQTRLTIILMLTVTICWPWLCL
jgi:hypothetical protein